MTVVVILGFIFGAWCGIKFHAAYIRSYVRQFGLEQFRRVHVDQENADHSTGNQP